jgi:GAF domain-containing protein
MGAKIAGKPALSWMGVPLMAHGEAIGALIVQDINKEHAFDKDDLDFLVSVASQVSGDIHNVRLLNESKQTALQFETAAEIARDISSSLDLDELLQKAVDLIRTRFSFYHASVFLKDLPGEFVVIREATGEAGAQLKRSGHKLAIGSKSIVGFVAGQGEALIVNDTTRDATYYPNPLLPYTRSEAAIPLKVGDRIVGVLDVQSNQLFAFNEDNLRTLQILADQLAIAVVNSELFAETQEHLAQHRLLHHITTTAASGTTLDEALQSAVNGLQVTLGGDRVAILLADREKKMLEVRAAVGYANNVYSIRIPMGSGITGWVASHRKTLRINNVLQDTRYIEASSNTRSEMAIPLLYRSELLGVLNVESELVAAYAENDEELLGTLGGSLAAIIANARLLEQIRGQAERERILFEITDRIRRTTDMDTILATTASELTRAIGANRARIRVGVKPRLTKPDNEGRK